MTLNKLRSVGAVSSINASASIAVIQQLTDMLKGVYSDLSQVISEWNEKAYPIFNTLCQGRSDSRWALEDDSINPFVNGLDGANLLVDIDATSSTQAGRYWRSDKSRPKTVKETLDAIYTDISNNIDSVRTEVATGGSGTGVTPAAQAAIGIHIFDSSQASAVGSLDELTQTNRANILQIAKDLYDDLYDNLTGDGQAQLSNYSVRDMVQALLLLHGGAWNTDVDLTHSGVGGSIGATYRTFCAGTNEETTSTSEIVVGGFTFDPSQFGTAISAMTLYFEGLLTYVAAGAAGAGVLRLYDLGAPGSIGAGVLRSTLTTGTTRNLLTQERNTLTPATTPAATNEIYNSERVYEIRLLSDGTGDPADTSRMTWGGIYIETV